MSPWRRPSLAEDLAMADPVPARDAVNGALPWDAFRATEGFVGRAATIIEAMRLAAGGRLSEAILRSDPAGQPLRIRNTVTGEAWEWTPESKWQLTQRGRREPAPATRRESQPPARRSWLPYKDD